MTHAVAAKASAPNATALIHWERRLDIRISSDYGTFDANQVKEFKA
jgi:hypothetical protein